jgi:hypothetical protein
MERAGYSNVGTIDLHVTAKKYIDIEYHLTIINQPIPRPINDITIIISHPNPEKRKTEI